jgi:hypothetical protein
VAQLAPTPYSETILQLPGGAPSNLSPFGTHEYQVSVKEVYKVNASPEAYEEVFRPLCDLLKIHFEKQNINRL